MAPKLDIRHLGKHFAQNEALRDVNLTLENNEFVSLVGVSGCGKSTLLSIVAGLLSYEAGEVFVDGTAMTGPGLDRGVVFQSYTLLPWLTARGNVEFALKAAGYRGNECREIANEHLSLVRLSKFKDAYPHELSGGMKQRVAIARALSYRPKVLLMDEPFGALDAMTRHEMQRLLTSVWETHKLTVLFVTHDVEEAVYLSDRIVAMTLTPGRIKTEFKVDLPRPRAAELIASSEFQAIQQRVLMTIRQDLVPDEL